MNICRIEYNLIKSDYYLGSMKKRHLLNTCFTILSHSSVSTIKNFRQAFSIKLYSSKSLAFILYCG